MNDLYSPESNLARQRKLDALFADQPFLSATMRASRLHERLEPTAACVAPLSDEADEILRKMVEGRAGGAYESAAEEWWFAPRPAVARDVSRPVRAEAPDTADHSDAAVGSRLTFDVMVDLTADGPRVSKVHSAESAPDVMTADEAAAYLRVSPATLRGWTRQLNVPHARLGRRVRYRRAALLSWLAAQED